MSLHNPQLAATEKHLTRLFVVGIFLFLLIFEVVFLASRYFLEKQSQIGEFENATNMILNNAMGRGDNTPQPRRNIGFLVLDQSGNVLSSRVAGQEIKNVNDIVPMRIMNSLDLGEIRPYDHLLLRKMAQTETGEVLLFLAPTNYDINGLMRDMFRFFLLDLLILMPFWWMARTYVRETLEPVRENLDTMTHFVHDAGHELKTPIAILSGYLQLMRDSKNPDPTLIEDSLRTVDGMDDSIQ